MLILFSNASRSIMHTVSGLHRLYTVFHSGVGSNLWWLYGQYYRDEESHFAVITLVIESW